MTSALWLAVSLSKIAKKVRLSNQDQKLRITQRKIPCYFTPKLGKSIGDFSLVSDCWALFFVKMGKIMKIFKFIATALTVLFASSAIAQGDLSRMNVIVVNIELGSDDNGMYIRPDVETLITGQAYQLVLTNVDDFKHELALNGIGERIFTRKIEVSDADGNLITEVKGAIREVEVGPGQVVSWFIVPVQTTDGPEELSCELPGHRDAGMFVDMNIN